ncbi:MAG: 30S ribosomal protein S5 [Candidatus Altiarchaeales archaeon HGW-Altiarchaeales-3]|nr:MAG: 30S ribosomal protein S5 [Candidatus Altiarchaeales archaeon HGW-Altiarchaeales-3]
MVQQKQSGGAPGGGGSRGGAPGGGGSRGGVSGARGGPRRGGPRRERRPRAEEQVVWTPRTKLGAMVNKREITNMHQLMKLGMPIREIEIVDALLPNLQEGVIDVARVQRTTDSGRRMRFRVVAGVGNNNGYVGVGHAKGKEVGPTIRKAIERAKLNIKEVKRGCGSWECGCGEPHTTPYKVIGKSGSVEVTLVPAPKGTGLVSGEVAKKLLSFAGMNDVWVHTGGHTRTSLNFAYAVLDALENTNYVKIRENDVKNLNIIAGESIPKEAEAHDERAIIE